MQDGFTACLVVLFLLHSDLFRGLIPLLWRAGGARMNEHAESLTECAIGMNLSLVSLLHTVFFFLWREKKLYGVSVSSYLRE